MRFVLFLLLLLLLILLLLLLLLLPLLLLPLLLLHLILLLLLLLLIPSYSCSQSVVDWYKTLTHIDYLTPTEVSLTLGNKIQLNGELKWVKSIEM